MFAKKNTLISRADIPGIKVVSISWRIELMWNVISEILFASPPANLSLKYLGEWCWIWSNIDILIFASTFGKKWANKKPWIRYPTSMPIQRARPKKIGASSAAHEVLRVKLFAVSISITIWNRYGQTVVSKAQTKELKNIIKKPHLYGLMYFHIKEFREL